jgi:predicted PurR-regulated permease PerM
MQRFFPILLVAIIPQSVSPHLMQKGVELHPLVVLFGVFAGAEIAGVAGMFLSVPVIAATRIVWRRLQLPDDVDTEKRALGSPLPERVAGSPTGRAGPNGRGEATQ